MGKKKKKKKKEKEERKKKKKKKREKEKSSAGSKDNFVAKGRTRFLERGEVQGHGEERGEEKSESRLHFKSKSTHARIPVSATLATKDLHFHSTD